MKEYYENNKHIIDHIINELILTKICREVEDFDSALQDVFLKLFPYVSEQGDEIEKFFKEYCDDYTVKEWYESNRKTKITKRI